MTANAEPKPEIIEIAEMLRAASFEQAKRLVSQLLNDPGVDSSSWAYLGKRDRFVLLSVILRRTDVLHPWLYERIREVEADPDGYIDIWGREMYKSTIITFAGSIQEIINDPEITIGIFAHTRPIAKSFLDQIKQESEYNPLLYQLYPDIFWEDPKKEAPTWSLDSGIVVKRKTNPKEKTVEAYGLVDGMPTAKHFKLMIYNDIVTERSVSTPEMILKTTQAWELSRNLSARGSKGERRTWHEGTRYNFADTYQVLINRGVFKPRVYPATEDGTLDGKPVLLTPEEWETKKRESSPFTVACQMLCNPIAGEEQEFKPEWVRRWEIRPETLNVAVLVDPANSKKKGACNTAFAVVGVDAHLNKFLLDGACHKMDLGERWKMLKYFRNKWLRAPGVQVVRVGYERYGMQTDIDYFEEMMRIENVSFPIEPVSWTRDDTNAKDDRIRRLIPDHQNWRFFYPWQPYVDEDTGEKIEITAKMQEAIDHKRGYLVAKPIKRRDHEGRIYNLVEWFLNNEYYFFPATTAKDFLDAMSRIYDLDINPPQIINERDLLPEYVGDD